MPTPSPEESAEPKVGAPATGSVEAPAYRPRLAAALAAVALLLVLGLGLVASRHKAVQDEILEEQRQLLGLKTSLLRAERRILLARNDESTLLLGGGADPIAAFRQRLQRVDRDWQQLEANPRAAVLGDELSVVRETIRRYEDAVQVQVTVLLRLGRAGERGVLDRLRGAEAELAGLFRELGSPQLGLRFADLRLRQRDFSNTLNIAQAESLLRDTDALLRSLETLSGSAARRALITALGSYRDDVFQAMSGVLELELATSQSSLRFDRVSPEIRRVEEGLDRSIELASHQLQDRRRAAQMESGLVIGGVFLTLLAWLIFETRRARAWIALETRLQQAQRMESLGVLTGGIAHDFNNLLTGVLGHNQLAMAKLGSGSPVHEHLAAVDTAAMSAADLVKAMLAYAGQARFVFEPCRVESLVDEMTRLFSTTISQDARLRVSSVPDLPAVEADASQLRQVVMNLVINASDALGGQPGTITVHTDLQTVTPDKPPTTVDGDLLAPGRYVCLEIKDDGCGMSEETRSRLFEPFFTTKRKGRGLGMAAVLGIVHAHKGAITVDSAVGLGSVFRVFLPVSDKPAPAATATPTVRRVVPRPAARGTVLLVDDDEIARVFVHSCLKVSGFEALVAEDGQRAVDLFSQHADRVKIVLLDMSMPGLDGEATYRELRRIRPEVKVILCSGHPEERVLARFDGLAGFLEKPFGPEVLVQKIFEALETRHGLDPSLEDGPPN